MNATCLCSDEMLRLYGMSALCDACAVEYAALRESEAQLRWAQENALPGEQLPLAGVAA